MKTYTVLFAEDVPHYGVAEIKAENDAAAITLAKDYDLSEVTIDAEWENSVCRRIIRIEDSEGTILAEDLSLDNCFLRYGGDADRILCDAAPRLLEALQWICDAVRINAPAGAKAYVISDQKMAQARAAIAKAKSGQLTTQTS
jgi:hypothetical protein